MNKFYEKCRENHLKITPQRTAVYKALTQSLSHPCAEQILREVRKDFPNISLDTVNRTLLTFAGAGMIDVVEGFGDPRRFDPNQETHHHFYCISCHGIFDFHTDTLDELKLPAEIEESFQITGRRICLTGYCENCLKQRSAEKS